jgi:hypothetical protein
MREFPVATVFYFILEKSPLIFLTYFLDAHADGWYF